MGSVGTALCIGCGASERQKTGQCSSCGSGELADVQRGAVVAWPAGASACQRCGSHDRPLVFRGTIRHVGALLLAWNRRRAGYYCEPCASSETRRSLVYTGLLGWWGLFSFLFWAPLATFVNWRSVWRPPAKPLAWGAVDASEYANGLRSTAKEDIWTAGGSGEEAPS